MIAFLLVSGALAAPNGGFRVFPGGLDPTAWVRGVYTGTARRYPVAQATPGLRLALTDYRFEAEVPVVSSWSTVDDWTDRGVGQARLSARWVMPPWDQAEQALGVEVAFPVARGTNQTSAWGAESRETQPQREVELVYGLVAGQSVNFALRLGVGLTTYTILLESGTALGVPLGRHVACVGELVVLVDETPATARGLVRLTSFKRFGAEAGIQVPLASDWGRAGSVQAVAQLKVGL